MSTLKSSMVKSFEILKYIKNEYFKIKHGSILRNPKIFKKNEYLKIKHGSILRHPKIFKK